MSAHHAAAGRGALASALTAVAEWLVEPVGGTAAASDGVEHARRPVVAVVGLHEQTGATVVARGLGALFAARDVGGACAVTAESGRGGPPLGAPAAGRLARSLGAIAPGGARAAGRLCLVQGADPVALCAHLHGVAPLIIDVADSGEAAAAASMSDGLVLVAGPGAEPALAVLVAERLAAIGPIPTIVVNRSSAQDRWASTGAMALPESRLGARAAVSGREPRGQLGAALGILADLWSTGP